MLRIGDQREVKSLLLSELLQGGHCVSAYAHNRVPSCLHCVQVVTEIAGLRRTTRGRGLRIEVDDNALFTARKQLRQ